VRLAEYSYSTIASVQGPLLFLDGVAEARMGEIVRVLFPGGDIMEGEVLKIERDTVLIQLFGDSRGLDIGTSRVVFTDTVKKAPLSLDVLDRIFNGSFAPIDGQPMYIPEKYASIAGHPINPTARARPEDFIETGFAAVDGLTTLVKGQKLPIFSCAGLPCKEMVAAILQNSRVGKQQTGESRDFVIVFVALGLTFQEYAFYLDVLKNMQTNFVGFVNLASDPVVERLVAPRFGLTVAEHLAFTHGLDVLVVMADITNYCDALREVATARKELPGRRGYPGYMYSDLASLFERAGRIKRVAGSVTMLPVITMPEDDITHPVPDLTGYITEGQVVLSREMARKALFPPIDVLPSLSRLMQQGIGKGRTVEDHRRIANLLYKTYAKGRDLRNLETIVGREGMSPSDADYLDFADHFEQRFVHQGAARHDIVTSIAIGRKLLEEHRIAIE